MLVIGVTGGLGTGKSTVTRMLGELGAVVIDADRVAHEVMEPNRLAWRKVVELFGGTMLNEDHTINRQQLGERVFRDPQARRQLEAVVHPQVIRRIKEQLRQLRRNRRIKVAVVDVPLLVETGTNSLVDVIVVVTAPPDIQRQRLKERGLSDADMDQRMAAQWDLSAKVALADHVVDNGDGVAQTRRQVKRLWNQLLAPKRKPRA